MTKGHPDKLCHCVSDAILDALLEQNPGSRCPCEVTACLQEVHIPPPLGWTISQFSPVCEAAFSGEDHFTPAGFAPERVFELEGQYTKMRCARHCHEDVYPNRAAVERMAAAEKNGVVPTELLPKCPRCGGPMEIHMADSQSFFQRPWFAQKQSEYQSFLNRANGKKLVILEFGIGWRNQLIKAPLMQLTAAQPQALYVTFNKGELYIPDEIVDKSIGVDGDIATAIREIVRCDL